MCVEIWLGLGPINSCVWVFGPQGMTLLEGMTFLVGVGMALLECLSLWGWAWKCHMSKIWLIWKQKLFLAACRRQSLSAACWSRYRALSSISSTVSACILPYFLPWCWLRVTSLWGPDCNWPLSIMCSNMRRCVTVGVGSYAQAMCSLSPSMLPAMILMD